VVAPSRTPKETLAQLSALFTSALRAPEVKTRLNSLGYYPAQMCGADFGAFLKREYEAYSRYVQEFNIKAE
jgi:tripartite-type tricarboxylate transporter receptor subunit TctC